MSIPNILPMINSLPHSDKFQLVQLILSQLAKEEGIYLTDVTHLASTNLVILSTIGETLFMPKIPPVVGMTSTKKI